MEASLAICILAALLATGSCLQCEVCAGRGTSCTGAMQTCPAGQESCAIARTVTTLAGVNTQSIHKHCVTSSQCKAGHISMNFGKGMSTRTTIACCVGDTCKATIVIVPPADTKPNGRSCRGCYSLSSEQCREETIRCTGSETQCLDAAGTITSGPGLVLECPDVPGTGLTPVIGASLLPDAKDSSRWKPSADGDEGLRFPVHLRPPTSGFGDRRRDPCKSNHGRMHNGLRGGRGSGTSQTPPLSPRWAPPADASLLIPTRCNGPAALKSTLQPALAPLPARASRLDSLPLDIVALNKTHWRANSGFVVSLFNSHERGRQEAG